MKNDKNAFLNSFAFFISFLAISSVNNVCTVIFGRRKS